MDGTAAAPTLRFDVLGPLRAHNEADELLLAVRKPNEVLAVLLASTGHEASAARLLDEVWDRNPDRPGMDLLKNAVYQLNKKFESRFAVRPIVSTGADGYLLDQETFEVDAPVFEELVRRVERNRLTADAESIQDWAAEAIDLWRGNQAFPGFEGLAVVEDYARTLAAKVLVAQKLHAEAALQLGRHEVVLGDIQVLARDNPFDESLCSSLMIALARNGRQKEAIQVYDQLRLRLVESSGVEPTPALQTLHLQILERHETVMWRRQRMAATSSPRPATITPGNLHDDIIQLRQRPFVGRSAELTELTADLHHQDGGGSRLRVVTGPAGMGKSRLVAALADREASRGRTVLYGRCRPERAGALDPISDLLQSGAGRSSPPEIAELVPADFSVSTMTDIDPAVELDRRIGSASDALLARLDDGAVLLIVEDAQWVDAASLAVLSRVTECPATELTMIVTCRPAALERDSGEATDLFDWLEQRSWSRLDLGPLDDQSVRRLVEEVLPERHRHRARAVADLVQRQAKGIPMLVTEVVHAVEYEAAKRRPFSLAHIEAAAPDNLCAAVNRRMLRLSRDAREALKAAAVAGSSFQLDVLSLVTGQCEDALAALLDECVGEVLITEPAGSLGNYTFAHELMRDAVLGAVGVNRRARLHRQFANAFDVLRGPAGLREQALHLLGALPLGDATEAVRVTCEAAGDSVRRFDVDVAIRLLHRAVVAADEFGVSDDLRCDLMTALAGVQSWSGEPVAAAGTLESALELARRADDPTRFAKAVLAPGTHHRVVFSSGTRLELLAESSERLRTSEPSAIGISIEANLLAESLVPGRYQDVSIEPDDLVKRARRIGDVKPVLDALFAAHAAAKAIPDVGHRTALSDEIVAMAESTDELAPQLCSGLSCRIYDEMSEGCFDGVQRTAERLGEVAEKSSMPRYRWRSMVVKSALHRVRGEFDMADGLSTDARTIGRGFDPADADAVFGMQMHDSLWHAGAVGALRDALEGAVKRNPVVIGHLLHAQALAGCDQIYEARRIWSRHRSALVDLPPEELWPATMALAAELLAGPIDDPEMAATVFDRLAPFRRQWVPVGIPVACWGPVDGYLGALAARLGRMEEARRLIDQATEQCNLGVAPAWSSKIAQLRHRLEGS